jgi:hypothetical protein
MRRHDHGSTVGHYRLDLSSERVARRTIHTGEGLIQQKQIRMRLARGPSVHPCAGEQYTTQLPV